MDRQATVAIVVFLMAFLIGCGREPLEASRRSQPDAKQDAPFEYRLVSIEEVMHNWGPQVVVNLETTNEVARNVTKEDLHELWQHLLPTLGDSRVFVYLKTPVPGAMPWALISRIRTDAFQGDWKVDIHVFEYAIDDGTR